MGFPYKSPTYHYIHTLRSSQPRQSRQSNMPVDRNLLDLKVFIFVFRDMLFFWGSFHTLQTLFNIDIPNELMCLNCLI